MLFIQMLGLTFVTHTLTIELFGVVYNKMAVVYNWLTLNKKENLNFKLLF